MNRDHPLSDERLQAFIDDEIDTIERAIIMDAVQKDEGLSGRLCELLQVKDAVNLAYSDPPSCTDKNSTWRPVRMSGFPSTVIAGLLLLTGGVTGWLIHTVVDNAAMPPASMAGMESDTMEEQRVVLHVRTNNPEKLEKALDKTERLLSRYRDRPEMVNLEIIADSDGLALLRMDTSLYTKRIKRMAREYQRLSFLACSRTIEQLQLKGIRVQLVPEARLVSAGADQIVSRLREGWSYVGI
jgi:intracellular sulfur oxidation DsrE/DsrF family protein